MSSRPAKIHSGKRIIADVPGFCLPDGGTGPPERLVTLRKPDIVMIDEKNNAVQLFELTSCADAKEKLIILSKLKQERCLKCVLLVRSWLSLVIVTLAQEPEIPERLDQRL